MKNKHIAPAQARRRAGLTLAMLCPSPLLPQSARAAPQGGKVILTARALDEVIGAQMDRY